MAEEKKSKAILDPEIAEAISKININLERLKMVMERRFDKLKQAIIDYINLGTEFAKGSLTTTLSNI